MKKLFATTVMIAALLSCAGTAAAGTYQGVASHDGTQWEIYWINVWPTCSFKSLSSSSPSVVLATIDGVDRDLTRYNIGVNNITGKNYLTFLPSPPGVLNKMTFQGQDSFQCEGHTFLLPGYVAPTGIPTMSEWAMILLGVLLAGGAALMIQRRRPAA